MTHQVAHSEFRAEVWFELPHHGPVTLIGKSRERLIDPQHLDPPPLHGDTTTY